MESMKLRAERAPNVYARWYIVLVFLGICLAATAQEAHLKGLAFTLLDYLGAIGCCIGAICLVATGWSYLVVIPFRRRREAKGYARQIASALVTLSPPESRYLAFCVFTSRRTVFLQRTDPVAVSLSQKGMFYAPCVEVSDPVPFTIPDVAWLSICGHFIPGGDAQLASRPEYDDEIRAFLLAHPANA